MTRRWVILLAAVVIVGIAGAITVVAVAGPRLRELLQPGRDTLPSITVEATYPGASAQVVADTVAAPIEQQVLGVEGMRYMTSRCDLEGRYTLRVFFEPRTDMSIAQVLVQNRVSLSLPVIPHVVQNAGINVRREAVQPLLFVILASPDGSFDSIYLSNYARIQLYDELVRVAGVGSATIVGERDHAVRLWLDPERLAARTLTATDVVRALEQQNLQVAATPDCLKVNSLGRLTDPEQLGEVVLKVTVDGQTVHVKDVGRFEMGVDAARNAAVFDGKDVALIVVHALPDADPKATAAGVRERLGMLRAHLPAGLDLRTSHDFSNRQSPEYLTLDIDLPRDAALERTTEVARRCDALVRDMPGVAHVLCLCGTPCRDLPSEACVLVELQPRQQRAKSRAEIESAIRSQLDGDIHEAVVRLRDPDNARRAPLADYPVHLALTGDSLETVRTQAGKLCDRLTKGAVVADVFCNGASDDVPRLCLDIDRAQATAMGVDMSTIMGTIQVAFGSCYVENFEGVAGRRWRVQLRAVDKAGTEDIKKLKVRSRSGEMVPLGALMRVSQVNEPLLVERLNGLPMVAIRANLAAGVSLQQARKQIEADAAELAPECKLTWIPVK
jgi:multidrug efflux pump subunit AcrB